MDFSNPIVGLEELIRSAIRSKNYVAGSAGWRIASDGSAEFQSLMIDTRDPISGGRIVIDSGHIYIYDASDNLRAEVNDHDNFASYSVPATQNYKSKLGNGLLQFDDTTGTDNPTQFGFLNQTTYYQSYWKGGAPGGRGAPEITLYSDTGATPDNTLFIDTLNIQLYDGTTAHNMGYGPCTFKAITASTGTITTTETVAITTNSYTYKKNRAYKVHVKGMASSSVVNDIVKLRVRKTNLAGTIMYDSESAVDMPVAGVNRGYNLEFIFQVGSGADVVANFVMTWFRLVGTGNCNIVASGTNPAYLQIEDLGLASDFPGVPTLV